MHDKCHPIKGTNYGGRILRGKTLVINPTAYLLMPRELCDGIGDTPRQIRQKRIKKKPDVNSHRV